MKVTFLVDHQSAATGNELYRAKAQADLPRASTLLEAGIVYEGWGKPPEDDTNVVEVVVEDEVEDVAEIPDLDTLTMAELRKMADRLWIAHSGLRKAQLVEVLKEAQ